MPLPCSCFLSWSTIILLLLFPNVNTEHILGIPIQGGTAREGFSSRSALPHFFSMTHKRTIKVRRPVLSRGASVHGRAAARDEEERERERVSLGEREKDVLLVLYHAQLP